MTPPGCFSKDGASSGKGFCPFSLFLFGATAYSFVRHLQSKSCKRAIDDATASEPSRVVFVLGVSRLFVSSCPVKNNPCKYCSRFFHESFFLSNFVFQGPGAGKGTQCQLLSEKLNWAHLSAGDLLREERKKDGSELADVINANISAGKIVPSEITVQLIKNAMEQLRKEKGQMKFLIDGFPRSEGNVNAWNDVVGEDANVECVLYFECPEDILTSRLLERGKTSGRSDDSIDVIRKRFITYRDESMPIIDMYEKEGKVRKIIADRSIEEIYEELEALLKN